MRYKNSPLRPGMTAVAAALALSSTPLFAQDAAVVESAPPVIAAPPPAPVPAEPVQAAPAATLNIPQISVNMDDAPKEAAETAAPVSTQRATKAQATKPRAVSRTSTPAPEPVPQATAPAEAVQALPVPAEPAPPPVVAMTPPPATIEPVAPAPSSETTSVDTDEVLPIAGGILGALALMGGAFAAFRRKRRYRDASEAVAEEPLVLSSPVAERPMPVRAPVAAPATAMPAADLPAGFDLSRYGPHVQAAYRGPTADNPSLSLRTRLKRARFYDQRERMAPNPLTEPSMSAAPQPSPALKPERKAEYVTSRRLGGGNVGFRPAFQN